MEGTSSATCEWIDPFCPLLSDRIKVLPGDPPQPEDAAARRSARALAHFSSAGSDAVPAAMIEASPVTLEEAVAHAARLIGEWRQPLFAGLGTDVAGARALTRLGLRCGAILDHAHGEAMTQALRALQDRGGFTCTLSEVRARADLIVCIGIDPTDTAPDFFARCGVGETVDDAPASRRVMFLHGFGSNAAAAGVELLERRPGVQVEAVDFAGADLHEVIAELNAACLERQLPRGGRHWPTLQALAAQLRDAAYAVLVYAPAKLPGPHAALLVEAISRLVKTLNRRSRAGSIALGAADGSAAVNHVVTWITGLPLRTALHAHGFDHDPHRFGTRRLLAGGAVDGLIWVSSFSPELLPPEQARSGSRSRLPMVVLGHPAMAAAWRAADATGSPARSADVFIAVSTPGVNAPGQLFRGDGAIALGLKPFMKTTLPSVADVIGRVLGLLERAA